MMGRKVRRNLPLMASGEIEYNKKTLDESDRAAKLRGKAREDSRRRARQCQVQPGDAVIVERNNRGKGDTRFHTKRFTVVEQNNGNLVLADDEGQILKRHVSQTRKVYEWRKPLRDNGILEERSSNEVDPLPNTRPIREKRVPGYLGNYIRRLETIL